MIYLFRGWEGEWSEVFSNEWSREAMQVIRDSMRGTLFEIIRQKPHPPSPHLTECNLMIIIGMGTWK